MGRVLAAILALAIVAGAETTSHPPLPREDESERKIAIIELDQPADAGEIQKQLKNVPDVKLRRVFRHALSGYSVEGTMAGLKKLEGVKGVASVSEVQTYQTQSLANIEMVGGETVRGFLDRKGERLSGKGVTIGVIDTGIDYSHPDLRRNYGGGHDVVDGDQDPMETTGKSASATLHGTHVAGIIAGNGKLRGLAPEAKIIAYRALGPGGSGTTEQIIEAIDQAIEDKVDVLNLSLGNEINGPDLPISLALNKAVKKGIVAVASAGNSGPRRWTVGSPGTASLAISVGASSPPLDAAFLKADGAGKGIRLDSMLGGKAWTRNDAGSILELTGGGLGSREDLINAKGKVALIERGHLTFTEKVKNAKLAGAAGVVIYNNTDGRFTAGLEQEFDIPAATISGKEGKQLRKLLQKGTTQARIEVKTEVDRLADFSSRGPVTNSWEIKPDLVAPGVAIVSTIPGGYLALQGTSMAAPHVAAAAALVKQAHPDWTPAQVKASLMNTAAPIGEDGKLYLPYEQGAGRLRADQAVQAKTLVMPGSIRFGRLKEFEGKRRQKVELQIENHGTETSRYTFRTPPFQAGLEWELPLGFHLKPGEKKQVELTLKVEPDRLSEAMYDGSLVLESGGDTVRIPYLYVLDEPDYPRVMGFSFIPGDEKGTYRYEVYLPGGADEFGIALFDPEDHRFAGFLDWSRKVKRGMLEKVVPQEELPEPGTYIAKVFARKSGVEDEIETYLFIPPEDEADRQPFD